MIFELLFILFFLVSAVCVIGALVMGLRGHGARAVRILGGLGIAWVAYLAVVYGVAAATPQAVVPFGQNRCFDEMCFAVTS
jgi:hypothetical protein